MERMEQSKESRSILLAMAFVFVVLIGLALYFWKFVLQLLLILVVLGLAAIVFIKGISYLFRFIAFTLKLGYKAAGVIVAISVLGWILFLFL